MAKLTCRIGLMFSTTGPYSTAVRPMLNGARLAIREAAEAGEVAFEPVEVNPGGDLSRYAALAGDLLSGGVRHVVGCYTSSSRKEVIPCFEKHDGLLWYPTRYEGFESSENVVYTGPAPNQHILPLIDHLMARFGDKAFCVGSNYVWAWENNRILREVVTARGGVVLTERYAPVGETDMSQIVEAICAARPSFVFSSFIGVSSHAFFRALRVACLARGIDQPRLMPVASCNLSEPDLVDVGEGAADGHLSSSVYFSTLDNPANLDFVAKYAAAFPDHPSTSADAEATYVAVRLLAMALAKAGTEDVKSVKAAVTELRLAAPQGDVWIDPETMHAHLTPRIGRSRADGRFDVLIEKPAPVRPDPYLVRFSPSDAWSAPRARLRVVN